MGAQVLFHVALILAVVLQVQVARVPDAAVTRIALELLDASGAADEIEQAGFVVRTESGAHELLRWPSSGFYSAKWKGAIPDGTVAVIHTHPRQRPAPSAQDRAEAKRLGLPFYVVSRGALCVASGNTVHCASRIPWLMRDAVADEALQWVKRFASAR